MLGDDRKGFREKLFVSRGNESIEVGEHRETLKAMSNDLNVSKIFGIYFLESKKQNTLSKADELMI